MIERYAETAQRRDRRVVHVIAPAPFGGAESVVVALAASDATVASVIVIRAAGRSPHPVSLQLRERGVTVDEVIGPPRAYFRQARQIRALIRARAANVVHTHGYHANVIGWVAARRLPVALVGTVHGYLGRDAKERAYDAIDRWVLRRFDAVIVVSEPLRDLMRQSGVRTDRLWHVPNGIDTGASRMNLAEARQALQLPPDGPIVGWTGRLSHEKGVDLLLGATARLQSRCAVAIIGDGPERETIAQHLATASSSGAVVRWLGAIPAAGRYLRGFTLLVLSSRREGSPMIVLEAAAAVVPVVAFRVGGIGELLSDDCAWLVPAGDVNALARAIDDALEHPEERVKRATAALTRLEQTHGLDPWRERVATVYAAAAQRRARR